MTADWGAATWESVEGRNIPGMTCQVMSTIWPSAVPEQATWTSDGGTMGGGCMGHSTHMHQGQPCCCLWRAFQFQPEQWVPSSTRLSEQSLGGSWQHWSPCAPRGAELCLDWNPHMLQAWVCLSRAAPPWAPFSRAHRACDPLTHNPAQHCPGRKDPLYSTGAAAGVWSWDPRALSQPHGQCWSGGQQVSSGDLQAAVFPGHQWPLQDAVSPLEVVRDAGNQKVAVGAPLPSITPRTPSINVFFSPYVSGFCRFSLDSPGNRSGAQEESLSSHYSCCPVVWVSYTKGLAGQTHTLHPTGGDFLLPEVRAAVM